MRSDLPKVLHPLLGVPLLGHVLEGVETLKPAMRVVVVGYAREQVEAKFANQGITWAVQAEQLGTAHAAHCGIDAVTREIEGTDAEVLIANGDLPLIRPETFHRLLQTHRDTSAALTILTCEKPDPTGYGRIFRKEWGDVCDIVEERDADEATKRIREVNVGVYVFQASTFRRYYAQIGRANAQGELYLTDVVVKAAQAGERVSTYTVADGAEVAQVNSRGEMAQVTEILRLRLLEEYMETGVTIDDPKSTYIEKGVSIGLDTRILPFTVIERGVEIAAGCEVGPFAHLRPGTRLQAGASIGNFVEIKNSTIGEGTKARHLSYVGDATIGNDVNIGAGTVFANYDGKTKNATVVKDGAFVGSGTVLVAPVTIGKGAITGAGSVVLKNRDVPDGGVVVGVPARSLEREGGSSDRREASPRHAGDTET